MGPLITDQAHISHPPSPYTIPHIHHNKQTNGNTSPHQHSKSNQISKHNPMTSHDSPQDINTENFIENQEEYAKVMRRNGRKNFRTQLKKLNKEKKAAKTLGIIVGCFIVCWMPFFTVYLIGAFCEGCTHHLVFSIFFWLGYCNSALNPCIYALFSKDFRYSFRNLLICKCIERKHEPSNIWHFLYTLRVNIATKTNGSDSSSE